MSSVIHVSAVKEALEQAISQLDVLDVARAERTMRQALEEVGAGLLNRPVKVGYFDPQSKRLVCPAFRG